MGEPNSSAVDVIIQARQTFLQACQALVSVEVDDNRAQALVDDAAAACAQLSSFVKSQDFFSHFLEKEHGSASQGFDAHQSLSDGGIVSNSQCDDSALEAGDKSHTTLLAWIQAVHACCGTAFGDRVGVNVADKLDSEAPSVLASWLLALRNLASAAHLAQKVICSDHLSQRKQPTAEDEAMHGVHEQEEGFSGLSSETVGSSAQGGLLEKWSQVVSLSRVWPDLGRRGGLRATRWRARATAADLAGLLAVWDLHLLVFSGNSLITQRAQSGGTLLTMYEELLQLLVHDLALSDLKWEVRLAALSSASKVLAALQGFLPHPLLSRQVTGMLAVCMDCQPEVQQAAVDSIVHHLLPPSSHEREVIVKELLDEFTTVAVSLAGASGKDGNAWNKTGAADAVGLDGLPRGSLLLAGVTAVIQLQLLPDPSAWNDQAFEKPRVDRVPLLLVAAAAAFEDAERRGSRTTAAGLSELLRSLVNYEGSLLGMLNQKNPTYIGPTSARTYKELGVIDNDTANALESVVASTTLKGLSVAISGGKCIKQASVENQWIADKQIDALEHITEVLQIPPDLTRTFKDTDADSEVMKFLACVHPLVSVAITLIKKRSWTPQQLWSRKNCVPSLVLCFSAFAAGLSEAGVTWAAIEGVDNLCGAAVAHLSEALQSEDNVSVNGHRKKVSIGEKRVGVRGSQGLILELLPTVLPRLKQVMKSGCGLGTKDDGNMSDIDPLPCAIVAAHQMAWCLNQVEHPFLGSQCELVMPCVLTALDHFSPIVKKQAMKACIHLADNLNPSELRWYKDATLDAVCSSLIGCEDLWPIAVQMAVVLVTRIEGKNPRGKWYGRVMNEMLSELERHRDDPARRTIWLQHITPQCEAMGIVLVAHFKRLLPLLFHWLHAPDDATCLLVLSRLCTIITHTWPRIPFHAKRMREELTYAYEEAETRKSAVEVKMAINEVRRLLLLYQLSTVLTAIQQAVHLCKLLEMGGWIFFQ